MSNTYNVGTYVRNTSEIVIRYGADKPAEVIPADMLGKVTRVGVEDDPFIVAVRFAAADADVEVHVSILDVQLLATYGMMKITTPACKTPVFCAWARLDTEERVIFTGMHGTYTVAKTELEELADDRGWELRWFDGEVEVK